MDRAQHGRCQRGRGRWAAPVVWLVVALVLGGVGWCLAEYDSPVSGSCKDVADASEAAEAGAREPQVAPVPLELAPDSDTTVDFRLRRKVRRASVFLQRVRSAEEENGPDGAPLGSPTQTIPSLPEPGTQLEVQAIDFERDGGDFELEPDHIWAQATVRNNREGVRLAVCVDPDGVPAGKYQGSIVFDDTRVTAGAIQWTVTLQYEKWWLVAYGALLVAAAAFFYSYSTTGSSSPSDRPNDTASRRLIVFAKDNFIGIAAGVATATVSFISAYWGSLDWGGDPDDWLKGAGVVFAAFTTGFLAQRMRSPASRPNPDGGAKNGADRETSGAG